MGVNPLLKMYMERFITFEHPTDEDTKYFVYVDPGDTRWFKVVTIDGDEQWEQLKKNPEFWVTPRN